MFSFHGVGIEGVHCMQRCPHFRNRGVPPHQCTHFRVSLQAASVRGSLVVATVYIIPDDVGVEGEQLTSNWYLVFHIFKNTHNN